jgi:diadenylate cyclase
LIIFQPELRQGLARLGQRNLFGTALKEEEIDDMLQEVLSACETMCKLKLGALIVIENKNPLSEYIENGVVVDGKVSSELIEAIFTPKNPLHDGGIILQHGRIAAAACLFPLTQNQTLSRVFGTRHRAALGLSEETDALVIVVSEERQDMSLVHGAKLHKDLPREEMISRIKEILKAKND